MQQQMFTDVNHVLKKKPNNLMTMFYSDIFIKDSFLVTLSSKVKSSLELTQQARYSVDWLEVFQVHFKGRAQDNSYVKWGVFFCHEEILYVAEQNFTAAEAGGKKKTTKAYIAYIADFRT